MLKEKLHIFGILGCVLCVVGSTTIVLHAPQERAIESVAEVWDLATEPGALLSFPVSWYQQHRFSMWELMWEFFSGAAFLFYAVVVLAATFVLIYYFIPQYGQTHIMVYIGVCSLVGSLSVCVSHFHLVLIAQYVFDNYVDFRIFFNYIHPFPMYCFLLTGHECESSWNSIEADLFWNEPANLPADMGVHYCCCCMHSNTDELSEQGNCDFLH